MPVERCQRDGERGWRWGTSGKCYLPSEEGSDRAAYQKAVKQGQAIEIRRHRGEGQTAPDSQSQP